MPTIEEVLRKSPLTNAQRADLWDAYHGAGSEDDLAAKLETYKIPKQVKAQLWDLKSSSAQPAEDFSDVAAGGSSMPALSPEDVRSKTTTFKGEPGVWGIGPGGVPMQIHPPTTVKDAVKDAKTALPAAGALAAMAASGGTAALQIIAAAALGGAGGKGVEHLVGAVADTDDTPTTAGGVLGDMAASGAEQGAYAALPAVGRGVATAAGKVLPAVRALAPAARTVGANPLAEDVVGMVSPRALHAMRAGKAAVAVPRAVIARVSHAIRRSAIEAASEKMAAEAAGGITLDAAAPEAAAAMRIVPRAAVPAAAAPTVAAAAKPAASVAAEEAQKVAAKVLELKAHGLSRPQMVSALRDLYGKTYMTPTQAGKIIDMVSGVH